MDEYKFLAPDNFNLYCEIGTNSICRVCMEKNQGNKKMYNIFEGAEPVFTMMMSCASVQIMQGDGLPNTICHKCLAKLNVAWQFKMQCESADNKLRQFYPNSNVLEMVEDSAGYNYTEKDLGINNGGGLQTATDYINEQKSDCKEKSKSRPKKVKSPRPKEVKIHQCDTCGKTFLRREYLTQHIRIHTGEKPYCCHICEKRFINSGHLTTHMRTHTGEKPHTCSLCPKAFSTRQELHKHTMVHNGDRPFVCVNCGKCFGSSSNLYSHLRHHTGEKNFTCEHCGKAFYTKQELKQHYVVHTGEKAYECEICNKKFSQSAHLRRHLKLHV